MPPVDLSRWFKLNPQFMDTWEYAKHKAHELGGINKPTRFISSCIVLLDMNNQAPVPDWILKRIDTVRSILNKIEYSEPLFFRLSNGGHTQMWNLNLSIFYFDHDGKRHEEHASETILIEEYGGRSTESVVVFLLRKLTVLKIERQLKFLP